MLGSNELGFINFPLIHTHHKVKFSPAHQWDEGLSTLQLENVSTRGQEAAPPCRAFLQSANSFLIKVKAFQSIV